MPKGKSVWKEPTDKQKLRRLYHVHVRLTQFRVDEVREFIDHSRSGMAGEWAQFKSRFDEATKDLDQDAIAEYVDVISDDVSQLKDTSPKLNRQAHCMMLYGTFESGLANMCRLIARHNKVPTKLPSRLHMKEIKDYLGRYISKRAFAKDWVWMDELRIVRNAFAHDGGKIERKLLPGTKKPLPESNWARLTTFLRRNPRLITVTDHNEIVIEDGLIDRAITRAAKSLAKFHNAVRKLYPKR